MNILWEIMGLPCSESEMMRDISMKRQNYNKTNPVGDIWNSQLTLGEAKNAAPNHQHLVRISDKNAPLDNLMNGTLHKTTLNLNSFFG